MHWVFEGFLGRPEICDILGPVAIWSRGAGSEESVIGDVPGSAPRGRPRGVAVADAVVKAGAAGIGHVVRGRSGRCCTFGRDPPSEDPRNHAETPRRSTPVKLSHVQSGPLCTRVLLHEGLCAVGPGERGAAMTR